MRRLAGLMGCLIVLGPGCGKDERAPAAAEASEPADEPSEPAAGPTAAPEPADWTPSQNQAFCDGLFGDEVKAIFGVDGAWKLEVAERDLASRKARCTYLWPVEGVPKGMIEAHIDCRARAPTPEDLRKAFGGKISEIDLDGLTGHRVTGTVAQVWMYPETPRCAVTVIAAMGAKENLEPYARWMRGALDEIPFE